MGLKPVNHKIGSILFLVIFLGLLSGLVLTPADMPEYRMAFIGSVLWVFAKFGAEKNPFDKKKKAFNYLEYMDAEWDNIGINLLGVFVVVPQMHNIVGLQQHFEYSDLWYYASGILTDMLYIVVVFIASLKKKYESSPPK